MNNAGEPTEKVVLVGIDSKIAGILAVFDDIAYRPNSYDFDKAAAQLQQLVIEARIDELQNLIHYHAMKKIKPLTYVNDDAQLGAAVRKQFLRLVELQAQLNKEVES